MYYYISAVAQTSAFDGQYKPVQLLTTPLVQIFLSYPSVYVTLFNDVYQREETLHLQDLPDPVRTTEQTLPQWLIQNGNRTLPTSLVPPTFTYRRVQFYDATYADFKVRPTNIGYHPDTPLSTLLEKDLLLTKAGVDYVTIKQNCLFTVNGYLHLADANSDGLYIYDGMRTQKNLNKNLCGIIDFQRIGTVECLPITSDLIVKRNVQIPYHDVLYLDLPVAPVGKKILLSIGGFLHTTDSLFQLVGDRTVRIDFKRFNWLERFYRLNEARGVDWSGVERVGGTFSKEGVFSDETLLKLFTLPNSFIIYVNTNELFVTRIPVEKTKIGGAYYSHEKIGLPLIGGEGLVKEYKHGRFDGQWTLDIDDYVLKTNVLHTTGWWDEAQAVTNTPDTNRPIQYSGAHWLVLSKTDEEFEPNV